MRTARAALGLTAVALAIAVPVGCGDDEEENEPAKPAGQEVAGSVVQFADCGDWREASVEEREATIDVLQNELTPQTAEVPDSALDDDRAYEILNRACEPSYAKSLRLYKLFVRAQGFAPLSE